MAGNPDEVFIKSYLSLYKIILAYSAKIPFLF